MSIVPYENKEIRKQQEELQKKSQTYNPSYQPQDRPAPQPIKIEVRKNPKLKENPQFKIMKYNGDKFTSEIVEIVNTILSVAHKQKPKDADTITYENTINFIRKIYAYTDEPIEDRLIEYFIIMIITNKDNENYYGENEYPFRGIENLETYKNIETTYNDIRTANELIFDIFQRDLNVYFNDEINYLLTNDKHYEINYNYLEKYKYKDLNKEVFFAFDNFEAKKNLSLIDKIYEIHSIAINGSTMVYNGWMLDFLEKAYGKNAKIRTKIINFFKKITKQFFEPLLKLVVNDEPENGNENVLQFIFIDMFIIEKNFNIIFYNLASHNNIDSIEKEKEDIFLEYLPEYLYKFPEICEGLYKNDSEEFKKVIKTLKNIRNSNRTNFILFVSSLFLSLGLLGAYFAFNKKKFNNYNY